VLLKGGSHPELFSLLTTIERELSPGQKSEEKMNKDESLRITEELWQRPEKLEEYISQQVDLRNSATGITQELFTQILSCLPLRLEKMITSLEQPDALPLTTGYLRFRHNTSQKEYSLSLSLNLSQIPYSGEISVSEPESPEQSVEFERFYWKLGQMELDTVMSREEWFDIWTRKNSGYS
tara:strand:- start:1410 stop:1949 length:540 start_codon:yes stop_codon:yes gene_type:complete